MAAHVLYSARVFVSVIAMAVDRGESLSICYILTTTPVTPHAAHLPYTEITHVGFYVYIIIRYKKI